jgi:hypothetical protein
VDQDLGRLFPLGSKPGAPTSLSSTAGDQQLFISFTPPSSNGGLTITNYEYAISTNSGSTYGSWTALSPSDVTSPVTIPVLTNGTTYYVKLRAVNSIGAGAESSPVTINTTPYGNPVATTGAGSDTTSTPSAPTTNSPTNLQSFGNTTTVTYSSGSGTWTNPYPSGAASGTGTLNGSSGTTSFIWGTSSGSYPNEVAATSNAYAGTTWARGTTVYYKAKITNTSCALQFTGTVNANGASTTVTFEYGTSSGSYPSSISAGTVTGASNTAVSANLSSLSAGTYYFRVKAVNASGTTYGTQQTVTISAKSSIASSEQSFTPPYVGTISSVLVVAGGGHGSMEGGGGGGVSASDSRSVGASLTYSVGGGGSGGAPGYGNPGGSSSLEYSGNWTMSATGGGGNDAYSGVGGSSGSGSGGANYNSGSNPGGYSGYGCVDGAGGGGGGAGGAGQGAYYVDWGPPTYHYTIHGGNGGAAVTLYGIAVSSGGGGQDIYLEDGIDDGGSTAASSYGGGYSASGSGNSRAAQGGVVRFTHPAP